MTTLSEEAQFEIYKKCLGRTHLKGFNEFITHSVYQNICNQTIKLATGNKISFCNLTIRPPSYSDHGHTYRLTPCYAKKQLLLYSSEMLVDMVIEDADGKIQHNEKSVTIAFIPI